jgi:hypothetical protein
MDGMFSRRQVVHGELKSHGMRAFGPEDYAADDFTLRILKFHVCLSNAQRGAKSQKKR